MNSFDFGWIVGIFEGEGSVMLAKTPSSSTKHVTLSLWLEVSQEHKPLLERFQGLVGFGRIRTQSGKPWMHKWEVYSKKAEAFLATVYPYLSEKRKTRTQDLLRKVDKSRVWKRRVCPTIER